MAAAQDSQVSPPLDTFCISGGGVRSALTGLVVLDLLEELQGRWATDPAAQPGAPQHIVPTAADCYGLSGGAWGALAYECVGAKTALRNARDYVARAASEDDVECGIGAHADVQAWLLDRWQIYDQWTDCADNVLEALLYNCNTQPRPHGQTPTQRVRELLVARAHSANVVVGVSTTAAAATAAAAAAGAAATGTGSSGKNAVHALVADTATEEEPDEGTGRHTREIEGNLTLTGTTAVIEFGVLPDIARCGSLRVERQHQTPFQSRAAFSSWLWSWLPGRGWADLHPLDRQQQAVLTSSAFLGARDFFAMKLEALLPRIEFGDGLAGKLVDERNHVLFQGHMWDHGFKCNVPVTVHQLRTPGTSLVVDASDDSESALFYSMDEAIHWWNGNGFIVVERQPPPLPMSRPATTTTTAVVVGPLSTAAADTAVPAGHPPAGGAASMAGGAASMGGGGLPANPGETPNPGSRPDKSADVSSPSKEEREVKAKHALQQAAAAVVAARASALRADASARAAAAATSGYLNAVKIGAQTGKDAAVKAAAAAAVQAHAAARDAVDYYNRARATAQSESGRVVMFSYAAQTAATAADRAALRAASQAAEAMHATKGGGAAAQRDAPNPAPARVDMARRNDDSRAAVSAQALLEHHVASGAAAPQAAPTPNPAVARIDDDSAAATAATAGDPTGIPAEASASAATALPQPVIPQINETAAVVVARSVSMSGGAADQPQPGHAPTLTWKGQTVAHPSTLPPAFAQYVKIYDVLTKDGTPTQRVLVVMQLGRINAKVDATVPVPPDSRFNDIDTLCKVRLLHAVNVPTGARVFHRKSVEIILEEVREFYKQLLPMLLQRPVQA